MLLVGVGDRVRFSYHGIRRIGFVQGPAEEIADGWVIREEGTEIRRRVTAAQIHELLTASPRKVK
jgi:hypothetical protein